MRAVIAIVGSVLGVLSFTAPTLAGSLSTDPNAIPGWQGTQTLTGANGSFHVMAEVDYAVYAPGQFGTSAALSSPAAFDPSAGSEYVYAYQVFNDGVGSNALVLNLSVQLKPGAVSDNSTNIGNAPFAPGLLSNLSQLIPGGIGPKNNAKWSYTTTLLNTNMQSAILVFTSPYGPQWANAAMQGGHGTAASSTLPSPTPEPASVVLCVSAVLCLLIFKRLRRGFA